MQKVNLTPRHLYYNLHQELINIRKEIKGEYNIEFTFVQKKNIGYLYKSLFPYVVDRWSRGERLWNNNSSWEYLRQLDCIWRWKQESQEFHWRACSLVIHCLQDPWMFYFYKKKEKYYCYKCVKHTIMRCGWFFYCQVILCSCHTISWDTFTIF